MTVAAVQTPPMTRPRLRLVDVLPKDASIKRAAAAPASEPNVIALLDTLAGEFHTLRASNGSLTIRVTASERGSEQAIRCTDVLASTVSDFEGELRGFERRLIAIESAVERIYQTVSGIAQAATLLSTTNAITDGSV